MLSRRGFRATACAVLCLGPVLAGCDSDGGDAEPSLKLTSPVGGERWAAGSVQTVEWVAAGPDYVAIYLSTDGGETWNIGNLGSSGGSGSLQWTVDTRGEPLPQRHCVIGALGAVLPGPNSFESRSGEFEIWSGVVWYVDGDPRSVRDGTSWETAFAHPQDAVDAASAGDEVWVAEGAYVWRVVNDPVITMRDGVSVYGEFMGTEANREERMPGAALTVLDGERVSNHVVVSASSAVLDGFTVTGGDADKSGSLSGGGIYVDSVTDFLLAGCTVAENRASDYGGGLYAVDSTLELRDCILHANSAGAGGGLDLGRCTVAISRCTFRENESRSSSGGGVYQYMTEATVSESVFVGNRAALLGGAMRAGNPGTVLVTNCVLAGNLAELGGGIAVMSSGSPDFVNCTFTGNQAMEGGAVYSNNSSPTLTGCVLWDDTASSVGLEVHDTSGAVTTATYSCVQGGWPGEGNIDADPEFLDPGHWDDNGTPGDTSDDIFVEGDYRLSSSSPCIDAGDPDSIVTEDIDGNPRNDGRVDMGAHEFVDDGVAGMANGAGCVAGFRRPTEYVLHRLLGRQAVQLRQLVRPHVDYRRRTVTGVRLDAIHEP